MSDPPKESKLGAVKPHLDETAPLRDDGSSPLGKGAEPPLHPPSAAVPKRRHGSENRQRRHFVALRLDDAEHAQLETRLAETGLSIGAYMRACSLDTTGPRSRRRPTVDAALLAQTNADLNRVGNNVNQIARQLNSGGDPEPEAIRDTLRELRATLTVIRRAAGYVR